MFTPASFREIRLAAVILSLSTAAVGWSAEDQTLPPPPEEKTPLPAPEIDPALPTIFIAGDSTAANGSPGAIGWGRLFPGYFDPAKVNIVNRARGGRSSRTFITEGLWDALIADAKAGDTVLIQFGHNDGGTINEEPPGSNRPPRARGSLPGLGDESQEIDNVVTKQHEVVHTFGWYVRKMIADVKAKGARPILLSLTVRNMWKDGRVERGSGQYGAWTRELAAEQDVTFLDLTNLVADEYERLGEEKVKAFFPKDHTHTSEEAADLNASFVVAGLKGLPGNPIRDFLSEKGAAVAFAPWAIVDGASERTAPALEIKPPPPPRAEGGFDRWLGMPTVTQPGLPTLFCIGDSTVRNGRGDGFNGQWGWGAFLDPWFDTTRLEIVNRAIGGLSSRTHYNDQWLQVRAMIKPGDFVIMQFGHNDNAPLNDERRARGTIKGTGDEWEAIDNMMTNRREVVHTFGWYLRQFIAETRARGATPIVCSLVPRKSWGEDGKITRATDSYADWARTVAAQEGVAFVDLAELVASRYDALGKDAVELLFGDEHTHTSREGAKLNARCVATGLLGLGDANPLAALMSLQAANLAREAKAE